MTIPDEELRRLSEEALMPCPFCGKPPRLCPDNSYDSARVFCPDVNGCPVSPSADADAADGIEAAIAAWNTRLNSLPAAPVDEEDEDGPEYEDEDHGEDCGCIVCRADAYIAAGLGEPRSVAPVDATTCPNCGGPTVITSAGEGDACSLQCLAELAAKSAPTGAEGLVKQEDREAASTVLRRYLFDRGFGYGGKPGERLYQRDQLCIDAMLDFSAQSSATIAALTEATQQLARQAKVYREALGLPESGAEERARAALAQQGVK